MHRLFAYEYVLCHIFPASFVFHGFMFDITCFGAIVAKMWDIVVIKKRISLLDSGGEVKNDASVIFDFATAIEKGYAAIVHDRAAGSRFHPMLGDCDWFRLAASREVLLSSMYGEQSR